MIKRQPIIDVILTSLCCLGRVFHSNLIHIFIRRILFKYCLCLFKYFLLYSSRFLNLFHYFFSFQLFIPFPAILIQIPRFSFRIRSFFLFQSGRSRCRSLLNARRIIFCCFFCQTSPLHFIHCCRFFRSWVRHRWSARRRIWTIWDGRA